MKISNIKSEMSLNPSIPKFNFSSFKYTFENYFSIMISVTESPQPNNFPLLDPEVFICTKSDLFQNKSNYFIKLFPKSEPVYFDVTKLLVTFTLFWIILTILKKTGLGETKHKNNVWKVLPGPKQMWIIGNAHQLFSGKDRMKTMTSWCLKYAPYFQMKIGPTKIVLLTTPASIKSLLASADPGHFNKADFYKVFTPFWNDGVVISKAEKWKVRRQLLAHAFTLKSFIGYMNICNKESKDLVGHLEKMFKNSDGKPMKIDKLLWKSTLCVICETTMGTDIWEIEGIEKLLETLNTCKRLCMMRIVRPWLSFNWIWKLYPESTILEDGARMLEEFTKKVVDLRKAKLLSNSLKDKSFEDDNSIIGKKQRFKSMIEEMIDAGFDEEALAEEAQTIITTGFETTATTIQFLLFLLALHPLDQKLCQEEIDTVLGDVSHCPNGDFSYYSLSNLKHLERCIQETLRLFPVALMYFRKLETTLVVDEHLELPPGTNVGVFVPGVHRNPEIFKNPDEFNPNRFCFDSFENENSENKDKINQYAYIPFSAGRRNCLGFKFGLLEVTVMVARILSKFNVKTTDTMDSVAVTPETVLLPERGYHFILEARE